MKIRQAVPADAQQLADLMKRVEKSGFMLFEPGERKTTSEQLQKRLFSMDHKSIVLVADEKIELKGYLFAMNEGVKRKQHCVHVAIGVQQGERGKGIGTQLFLALEQWAKDLELHRIELTVLEHNQSAIALYKKMGFAVEGLKRDSLLIDSKYVNELYMSKLL
ncbi:acetyltransferase [Planococcus antarcticus DSM 14505]|uniref:Acetyltransferase n=1 Tax=Planococcus antarcticus DSM 14505 TaxID=1185653 RepID=A0A1C7DIB9_9BACL|nr:GNAT family N-acetyltransferase [Planococcus antarcticus]ANU10963.1 GNAT family N-acetyltransferase [Planococcus antarcticus DSM 14505]EIM07117.1 acetyltransferase [Planococcus antarcticus DSM 14505]